MVCCAYREYLNLYLNKQMLQIVTKSNRNDAENGNNINQQTTAFQTGNSNPWAFKTIRTFGTFRFALAVNRTDVWFVENRLGELIIYTHISKQLQDHSVAMFNYLESFLVATMYPTIVFVAGQAFELWTWTKVSNRRRRYLQYHQVYLLTTVVAVTLLAVDVTPHHETPLPQHHCTSKYLLCILQTMACIL